MKSLKERILTVGNFPYSRAILLQVQLQTEGIESFLVQKETTDPGRMADIRVQQKDVAHALIIINSVLKASGAAKEKVLKNMGMIRRILVPVDFSGLSVHACRFAVSMARKYKAEVKLLHVFYNPAIDITPYDEHYAYQLKLSNSLREIEKNARINLFKLEEKMKTWCLNEKIRDVKIVASLANGEAADEIITYAKKYRPALIIMGTRGLTKGTHPLGRVVSHVIENTHIPVLALPDKSLNHVEDLKNVLYATDFDPSDYAVINRLLNMLSPFSIRLHCVHVSVGVKKPWDPVKMEELKMHLEREYHDKDLKFNVIVGDNLITSLETYIRNNRIDSIAVVTHQKGAIERLFAPSLTKKIFSETGKPLFVFHAGK